MRKSVLAVLVMVTMTTLGVFAEGRPPEAAKQQSSYVVASAEESRNIAQASLPARGRQDAPPAVPGTLPLLFVGSLLLGLAAAVRRTT